MIVFGVSACAVLPTPDKPGIPSTANAEGQMRPAARPNGLSTQVAAVPTAARTAEEFDTTTAEQRSEASSSDHPSVSETSLGSTIASLGSPSEPGFWLKTPLVSQPAKGKVTYPGSGKSVMVDLIPIDGEKTAGSRMSLPAMRLIDAPLTGLPEVQVFQVSS